MDSVVNAGIAEATNQLDYDDEVGFQAVASSATSPARPTNGRGCSRSRSPIRTIRTPCASAYWDRYDHDAIDLPRVGPLPDDELDPHSRRLRHVSAMDEAEITEEHVRTRPPRLLRRDHLRRRLGRRTASTRSTRAAWPTTPSSIFTADHGDMLGERGLWYKMSFFEGACRIPLIVAGPGVAPARRREHVSLLDVLPTLLDLAGVRATRRARRRRAASCPLLAGDRDPNAAVSASTWRRAPSRRS